jgi:hypothetical protein
MNRPSFDDNDPEYQRALKQIDEDVQLYFEQARLRREREAEQARLKRGREDEMKEDEWIKQMFPDYIPGSSRMPLHPPKRVTYSKLGVPSYELDIFGTNNKYLGTNSAIYSKKKNKSTPKKSRKNKSSPKKSRKNKSSPKKSRKNKPRKKSRSPNFLIFM